MPQSVTDNSHLIEYLGIKALRASHPQVRKLKRQQIGHSAHGNKVWRSSFVLMDYLTTYPPEQYSSVLDIGCGWGLTGLFVAKHYDANVTGIDIDKRVEPFLGLHAKINGCQMAFEARSFTSLSYRELADYQLLMGTDICFWDDMTRPLFDLISLALKVGVERIIIADPGRPPFWALVDLCAEAFQIDVVSRRIYEPWKTEKFILAIDNA
jgi:predicted nicotinamide N-methyase